MKSQKYALLRRKNPSQHQLPTVPYHLCPAKTFTQSDGTRVVGRSVVEHCNIVGEVAREIIARYPDALRNSLFPEGAILCAAAHDIGKVSPCFYERIRKNCTSARCSLDALPGINPQLERMWGGHAGVSQLTAKHEAVAAPEYVPEILGQHHGFSPSLSGRLATDETFGGRSWQQEREKLVVWLKDKLKADWPQVDSFPKARLLAGLTSVSDWIGSGKFFEDPKDAWTLDTVAKALDHAGFVKPAYQTDLTFQQVFGFSPHTVQKQFIEQVVSPGVYVLEAPMGMGKTEAALYAAYRMLTTSRACGVYFALPTRLTSNRIHARFEQFLKQILATDCPQRTLLAHSQAHLLIDTDMGEDGRPGGAWFDQTKRKLLAPFAVGTIDQSLMATMNVKHGFVRAFGLAGKVVILDEVHTYDAYTGTLLDALVALLRALDCTVIILSATLNKDRRQKLLCNETNDATLVSNEYPLITAAHGSGKIKEVGISANNAQTFKVHYPQDDIQAVKEVIARAKDGQQVLWVENTVKEAQERYLDIAHQASVEGIACGLLHSRFTVTDRQQAEDKWVNFFGKEGWPERGKQGRILVGTQVLEQSLDIDADFLVSRFAPTDMLLQRMGRLWRHADTPRALSAVPEIWLLVPGPEMAAEAPEQAFGPTAYVYSPYVLCRSLDEWQGRGELRLPTDIRTLIENTYCERDESPAMQGLLHDLDQGTSRRMGRKALSQLAQTTLSEGGNTLPDKEATTRYSEREACDLLLLRDIKYSTDKKSCGLMLLDGSTCSLPRQRHYFAEKTTLRKVSLCLMQQVVSVPVHEAPQALPIKTLEDIGLHNVFYLGNPEYRENATLRMALVANTGELSGFQGSKLNANNKTLDYRDDLGYRVLKT